MQVTSIHLMTSMTKWKKNETFCKKKKKIEDFLWNGTYRTISKIENHKSCNLLSFSGFSICWFRGKKTYFSFHTKYCILLCIRHEIGESFTWMNECLGNGNKFCCCCCLYACRRLFVWWKMNLCEFALV